MQWKSWKAMSDEMNYNFDDINDDILTYIDMLLAEQYKQWKRDLHQYFETFDDLQVALEEGCPKEFKAREDNWGNREKKTLLHHSGLRPFSYKMEVRRQGGSKFSEIDIFSDVCVRPEHELVESLHVKAVGRVRLPASSRDFARVCGSPEDAGFQILTETLDQTLERRPRTYCRGIRKAWRRVPTASSSSQSKSQVIALTAEAVDLRTELASYKSEMSQIV
ncbi:unnamed protein product [Malus baccata var. baccata]